MGYKWHSPARWAGLRLETMIQVYKKAVPVVFAGTAS